MATRFLVVVLGAAVLAGCVSPSHRRVDRLTPEDAAELARWPKLPERDGAVVIPAQEWPLRPGPRDVLAAARQVYALHGTARDLAGYYPKTSHSFPEDARAVAYEILDRHLRGAR